VHYRGTAQRALDAGTGETSVEANSRLTAGAGGLLFLLLAAEGVTILQVRGLLTAHIFIGMILIPPVLLKMGSTGWRFFRYYTGSPAYVRKGPPAPILRLLGPAVVVLTVAVLASGVALVLAPTSDQGFLLQLHKASFVLWFGVTAIHVLGHAVETARIAPADWARRTRRQVAGASRRQWFLVGAVAAGAVLGAVMLGPASHYRPPLRVRHEGAIAPATQPVYPVLSET
jgi:hypothetical protein